MKRHLRCRHSRSRRPARRGTCTVKVRLQPLKNCSGRAVGGQWAGIEQLTNTLRGAANRFLVSIALVQHRARRLCLARNTLKVRGLWIRGQRGSGRGRRRRRQRQWHEGEEEDAWILIRLLTVFTSNCCRSMGESSALGYSGWNAERQWKAVEGQWKGKERQWKISERSAEGW